MQVDVDSIVEFVRAVLLQVPPKVVNGFALFGALCVFLMVIRFFIWLVVPNSTKHCRCHMESMIKAQRSALYNFAAAHERVMCALTSFQTKALSTLQEVVQPSDDEE